MKTAAHNKDGTLAHSQDCVMSFGRKDSECPRCVELINGAIPRKGWQADYYANKANNEKLQSIALEQHRKTCPICNGLEKGVCTFGEW